MSATAKEDAMCRWMAWHGQPVLIEELLFKTQHGIVDQSLHSRMGAEPTNGDGLGWAGTAPAKARASTTASLPPGATRTCASSPRTSSRRCSWCTCGRRSGHRSRRPTAIPSATGAGCSCTTATSVTSMSSGGTSCWRSIRSCSPASWGRPTRRWSSGSRSRSDSRTIRSDALERTVGLIEATATERGVAPMVQGTFGVSDGSSLWAVRYAHRGPGAVPVRVGRRRLAAPARSRKEDVVRRRRRPRTG